LQGSGGGLRILQRFRKPLHTPTAADRHRTRFDVPPIAAVTSERMATSGKQASLSLWVAEIFGSEKDRCLFSRSSSTLLATNGRDADRWQGPFQGQFWGQSAPRKPRGRLYLAFQRGEVAERLKAAVC